MPSYKLTYFDAKGRGELPRILMHYGGIQFEEVRVKFADWGALKSKTLFRHLPELTVDGKTLSESGAIIRFLSKQIGLTPTDDFQAAEVDMLTCKSEEILLKMVEFAFSPEAQKAEQKKQYIDEKLPKILQCLEDYLGKNGGVYFVGGKISTADLVLYSHLNRVPDMGCTYEKDKFPKIKKLIEAVEANPKIQAYQAKSK